MGCVAAVQEALQPLPGVASVEVDFGNKTATCKVDPKKFDAQAAVEKLVAAGYEKSALAK